MILLDWTAKWLVRTLSLNIFLSSGNAQQKLNYSQIDPFGDGFVRKWESIMILFNCTRLYKRIEKMWKI